MLYAYAKNKGERSRRLTRRNLWTASKCASYKVAVATIGFLIILRAILFEIRLHQVFLSTYVRNWRDKRRTAFDVEPRTDFLPGAPLLYSGKVEQILRVGFGKPEYETVPARSYACNATWETDGIQGYPGIKLIFGLGTGRCGTLSLAQLLSHQNKIYSPVIEEGAPKGFSAKPKELVTHERGPLIAWEAPSPGEYLRVAARRLDQMTHRAWRYCYSGGRGDRPWWCGPSVRLQTGDVASPYLPYVE
ncbi:hypothetical protein CYMTET_27102, partial [Cymbomonas tetramitiformis]